MIKYSKKKILTNTFGPIVRYYLKNRTYVPLANCKDKSSNKIHLNSPHKVRIIRSPPAAVAGQESTVQYPITQVEKFPPLRWNKVLFSSVADP